VRCQSDNWYETEFACGFSFAHCWPFRGKENGFRGDFLVYANPKPRQDRKKKIIFPALAITNNKRRRACGKA
jgi:hypothetical protein